jgi:hypothetical protein
MALIQPAVIGELEQLAAAEIKRLTLTQVQTFVAKLKACEPVDAIAAATGMDDDDVIDLGAKLGTWLTHVLGSVDVEIELAVKQAQPTLFPGADQVVIPAGFERRAKQRRDIVRALATIIVHDPDDATLQRFLDRLYPSKTSVLAARDVFVVWRFAQLGRIDDLARISSNPAFNRTMASAFYTLETAVRDAEAAFTVMVDLEADPADVHAACVTSRWVREARISKMERLAAQVRDGQGSENLLRRDQRYFGNEIAACPPAWTFTSVADLVEGQVLRIVEAAGLVGDDSRRDALDIRSRLVALGEEHGYDIARDLDRLVPEGLRAKRAGVEDLYWEGIEARIAGDPNWREIFESAMSDAV